MGGILYLNSKYSFGLTTCLNLLSRPSKLDCRRPTYWKRHSPNLQPGIDDLVELVVVAYAKLKA